MQLQNVLALTSRVVGKLKQQATENLHLDQLFLHPTIT